MNKMFLFVGASIFVLLGNMAQANEMSRTKEAKGKLLYMQPAGYVCVNNPSPQCAFPMEALTMGMGGQMHALDREQAAEQHGPGKHRHLSENHLCLNNPNPECANPVQSADTRQNIPPRLR
ncbi:MULTISPECIES: hypothetical protein [unclassified Picosynechococcus]|uniref:hypothetical protein n=1 Tax=unclassified Picosynechococcus TaxID=3079910 RepID=UPI0004AB7D62|nr:MULTISPECIES: hypothetical protein [unclassified Picosynechococcus]AMA09198.1 hypothetical protein AWQ23_07635 [Picosynechococcus sp. PCC 73109]ANV90489.1 hypothetical protein AWQ24_07535 [Picosynechococcus sp. PCC 8807]QCS50041.1 hypothetical protein FEK30_11680 [Picosynechococcus sp. PCC 11901]